MTMTPSRKIVAYVFVGTKRGFEALLISKQTLANRLARIYYSAKSREIQQLIYP